MSDRNAAKRETYILEIEWDVPNLPERVGPFDSREEAGAWAELNIPNGSWLVAPVAYPWMVVT